MVHGSQKCNPLWRPKLGTQGMSPVWECALPSTKCGHICCVVVGKVIAQPSSNIWLALESSCGLGCDTSLHEDVGQSSQQGTLTDSSRVEGQFQNGIYWLWQWKGRMKLQLDLPMIPSMKKVPKASYLSSRHFKISKWVSSTTGLHAFQSGIFELGFRENESVSEPFGGGEVSVPYKSTVFIVLVFQNLAFRGLISLVQDLRAGMPDMEHHERIVQYFWDPSWLWTAPNRMGLFWQDSVSASPTHLDAVLLCGGSAHPVFWPFPEEIIPYVAVHGSEFMNFLCHHLELNSLSLISYLKQSVSCTCIKPILTISIKQ